MGKKAEDNTIKNLIAENWEQLISCKPESEVLLELAVEETLKDMVIVNDKRVEEFKKKIRDSKVDLNKYSNEVDCMDNIIKDIVIEMIDEVFGKL